MKKEKAMNTDKIYAEQLANEYAPKDTSKVVALRKLDARAKRPANIFTYTLGVIAALVFGTGMCLAMGQIGSGSTGSMILGIVIGIVGMFGMGINYPLYRMTRRFTGASIADRGVKALSQLGRDAVAACGVCRRFDLGVGRIPAAHADVFADGVVEEVIVLRNKGDLIAKLLQRDFLQVVPAHGDRAVLHIPEACNELCQRRFAGAGGADQRGHAILRNTEADIVRDLRIVGVAEGNLFDLNTAA